MKQLARVFLFFVFFTPVSFAATPAITELFPVDETPGSGTFLLSGGEKKEEITLGTTSGLYAVGMVFPATTLPDAFKSEFQDHQVIQIILGNQRATTSEALPQFGALSLIVDKIPTRSLMQLKFQTTKRKTKPLQPHALMLFSSSKMKLTDPEADKLKSTFFASEGTVSILPQGKPQFVNLTPTPQEKLKFKRQNFQLTVKTTLSTPFSPSNGELAGTFIVPVYWPAAKKSENLVRQLAADSFAGTPYTESTEEGTRDLTSQPQESK